MDAAGRKGTAMRSWWVLVGAGLLVMAADPAPEVAKPEVAKPDIAKPDVTKPDVAKPEVTKADATGVLSRMVRDADGKEVGRIVDVVVDPAGQPRAIVVDVGGFMGLGARRVAVSWPSVHVPPPDAADKRVAIDLTDAQVRSAPDYTDRSKPVTIVGPPAPPVPTADNEK